MIRTGKDIVPNWGLHRLNRDLIFIADIDAELLKVYEICKPIRDWFLLMQHYSNNKDAKAFIGMVNSLEKLKG